MDDKKKKTKDTEGGKKGTKTQSTTPVNVNPVHEQLPESDDDFSLMKFALDVPSLQNNWVLAVIFKQNKATKAMIEKLNKVITKYNNSASALYLDVGEVDDVSSDILKMNADMIKNLEKDSKYQRVTVCGGKLTAIAFKTLLAIKKPKIPTKVFESDVKAINNALGISQ